MRRALEKYGIRPRRKFGQHFLQDENVRRREVAYAELGLGDTVLEVGPGTGRLTELLLQQTQRVVAIEVDAQFKGCLSRLQERYGNLEAIWGDALEVDLPRSDKVVANLPYRIALPLIFRLLEHRFDRAVLIFQKRLAERICASVGEKGYCRLSVAIGRRANAELLETVPRSAFYPSPEVESAIVKIERVRPKFDIPSEEFFKLVLEQLFRHRDESVQQAVQRIRNKELAQQALSRGLANISGKVKNKPVYLVTPREFSRVSWAFWNELDRSRPG